MKSIQKEENHTPGILKIQCPSRKLSNEWISMYFYWDFFAFAIHCYITLGGRGSLFHLFRIPSKKVVTRSRRLSSNFDDFKFEKITVHRKYHKYLAHGNPELFIAVRIRYMYTPPQSKLKFNNHITAKMMKSFHHFGLLRKLIFKTSLNLSEILSQFWSQPHLHNFSKAWYYNNSI